MKCTKCKKEIPDESVFCMYCGKKQTPAVHGVKKRGNGQGSVYKRSNLPSWTAEVTVGYYLDKDGKPRRKYKTKSGFKTKRDAVAYIEKLREERKRPKTITVQQLWFLYRDGELSELSKSKRTAYLIAWKKIENELSFKDIDSLTVTELQAVIDKCGTSYYTKRDMKVLLSHLYKIAIRDDYTDKNRAQYIRLPSLETTERTTFTEDEILILWDDYHRNETVVSACMLIMLYTGMRPGELLHITKDTIHLSEQYLTGGIKTSKGKNRKIIIPDKIVLVIRHLMELSNADTLLTYKKNDFYDDWKECRERLELRSELDPYCCRHTYVTRLTALKVSPAMLQELAGHEDYETTLDYTHLSIEDRLIEVNRLQ